MPKNSHDLRRFYALEVAAALFGTIAAHGFQPPLSCTTPGDNPIWSNDSMANTVGGVGCTDQELWFSTSFAVAFDSDDFDGPYSFSCLRIATTNAGAPLPSVVAIYLDPDGGTPDMVDLLLLSVAEVTIPSGAGQFTTVALDSGTLCVDLEQNETLVVSLHVPDSTDSFVSVSGGPDSSRETFFRSTACGLLSFVSMSSIGWPDRHWLVELSGSFGCDTDCDGDGVSDAEEISKGAPDSNRDGVVDECQCIGDLTHDGQVDGADLALIIGFWGPSGGATIADINADTVVDGADLSLVIGSWGVCPVVILDIDPPAGIPSGGTTLTLRGQRLSGTTGVYLGGIAAHDLEVIDGGVLRVTTPVAKSVGPVDVTVTTADSSFTLADAFTYRIAPAWATVLQESPDPSVVVDATLRDAIIATGLPWRVTDSATGIEMLLVPPRSFIMGCTPSLQTPCADDEQPPHTVGVTMPFYLGRYELTQQEWVSVMGFNPSQFSASGDSAVRPVERVSWNMVQTFGAATGLRMPTEAEWELACRAGTDTAFSNWSSDEATAVDIAWCSANSAGQTHPVGLKPANPLGFHDMHGNVYEWCADWVDVVYYSYGPTVNPTGPFVGLSRILRGGGWSNPPDKSRSSNRGWAPPTSTFEEFGGAGFRVARTP